MSIEKIKFCGAIYIKDEDNTTGHWKSFDMLNPQDIEELRVLVEILENEPESLEQYNIFKKIKNLAKEK